jgi:hypothetical protein
VLAISQIMPSFASERIADVSFLINRKISGDLARDFPVAYFNINDWHRSRTGERLKTGTIFNESRPVYVAFLSLALWTMGGFIASYWLLGKKERG